MAEVSYKVKDGVAVLSIDRPEALNALSASIVKAIGSAAEEIACDADVKALLIYSRGNFAAGADIKAMAQCDEEAARNFVFSPYFNKIEDLEIPTIAAIEGYALGGGLELALVCDMRFASEDAKLGFPEINLGIMPGAGGTVRTPQLIGTAAAKELIFSGETISADRAEKLGLVNRVFPKDELYEKAYRFAEKLSRKAPIALKTAKKTIEEGLCLETRERALSNETDNWAGLFNTQDQKEGMGAFLEKRKPVYQGR